MSSKTIEIADLVKPKFKPNEKVYWLDIDQGGNKSIIEGYVKEILYAVKFYFYGGRQCRDETLTYILNQYEIRIKEDCLFSTAQEAAKKIDKSDSLGTGTGLAP